MEDKVSAIIDKLKERYADAPCALHYEKDYELMIAVRLSAQCTDARVNLVTPGLFAAYPTLEAMAGADIADVERHVHSCGFYKHKARDIVLACQMLLTQYGGRVPGTMEELLKLPGVGRKTANLLLGDLYGAPGSGNCGGALQQRAPPPEQGQHGGYPPGERGFRCAAAAGGCLRHTDEAGADGTQSAAGDPDEQAAGELCRADV